MTEPVALRFDASSVAALNVLVAFMMFGASLTLVPDDFVKVLRAPRALLIGLAAQYLLFPALVTALAALVPVDPGLALGAIFMAALPGGSFSNVLTWMARANVALSVGMTAIASLASPLLTPLSLSFWGRLLPGTRAALTDVTLPGDGIVGIVLLVLALPIVAGMLVGQRFPRAARRAERPLRTVTLLLFLGFIALAFAANRTLFVSRFHEFFWIVAVVNALALGTGLLAGRLTGLALADARAIAIEIGIKNAALGLVILFTFFPQGGGLLLITSFWGVWHLVSGTVLAQWWGRGARGTAAGEPAP